MFSNDDPVQVAKLESLIFRQLVLGSKELYPPRSDGELEEIVEAAPTVARAVADYLVSGVLADGTKDPKWRLYDKGFEEAVWIREMLGDNPASIAADMVTRLSPPFLDGLVSPYYFLSVINGLLNVQRPNIRSWHPDFYRAFWPELAKVITAEAAETAFTGYNRPASFRVLEALHRITLDGRLEKFMRTKPTSLKTAELEPDVSAALYSEWPVIPLAKSLEGKLTGQYLQDRHFRFIKEDIHRTVKYLESQVRISLSPFRYILAAFEEELGSEEFGRLGYAVLKKAVGAETQRISEMSTRIYDGVDAMLAKAKQEQKQNFFRRTVQRSLSFVLDPPPYEKKTA